MSKRNNKTIISLQPQSHNDNHNINSSNHDPTENDNNDPLRTNQSATDNITEMLMVLTQENMQRKQENMLILQKLAAMEAKGTNEIPMPPSTSQQSNDIKVPSFITPAKNLQSTPPSMNSANLVNSSINSTMTDNSFTQKTNNRSITDDRLHHILNYKLTLDIGTAPKLSGTSITADEYVEWYEKIKNIVHANPKFKWLLTAEAEDAWDRCGGKYWAGNLPSNDEDRFRWETAFLDSLCQLYSFIVRLIPEEISRGILLQMRKDKNLYNVPRLLKFCEATCRRYENKDQCFHEDVFSLMKLLQDQYNFRDCSRVNDLLNSLRKLYLKREEHPSTAFTRYQELVNRIRDVYPVYPEPPESLVCLEILRRLPSEYETVREELHRMAPTALTKEIVLNRLAVRFAQFMSQQKRREAHGQKDSKKYGISKEKFPSSAIAAAAYPQQNEKPSAQRMFPPMKCFHCHKEGHKKYECPELSKAERALAAEEEENSNDEENSHNQSNNSHSEEDNVNEESHTADFESWPAIEEEANSEIEEIHAEAHPATFTSVLSHQGIADSGSTLDITGDKSLLRNIREAPRMVIHGVGGQRVSSLVGDMYLPASNLKLNEVRYIPGHPTTLFSMAKLNKSGFDFFSYDGELFIVEDKYCIKKPERNDPRVVAIGRRQGNLYTLDIDKPAKKAEESEKNSRMTTKDFNDYKRLKKEAQEKSKAKNPLSPQELEKVPSAKDQRSELENHRETRKFTKTAQSDPQEVKEPNSVRINSVKRLTLPTPSSASKTTSSAPKVQISASQPVDNVNNVNSSSQAEAGYAVEFAYAGEHEEISPEMPIGNAEIESSGERIWHRRLGHASRKLLEVASKAHGLDLSKDKLQDFQLNSKCKCEVCMLTRVNSMVIGDTTANRINKAAAILDRWHVDLVGPISFLEKDNSRIRVPSMGGNIYAMIVVDEYSQFVWTIPLQKKSDAADRLIELITKVENQLQSGKKLKRIHTDQGTEFVNEKLKTFIASKGIEHETSPAYLPQYNGVVERMNQLLNKFVRSLLEECGAPPNLWGNGIMYATQLHNMLPVLCKEGRIPAVVMGMDEQLVSRHVKDKFKVFGCNAFPIIQNKEQGKFQGNRLKGINLGWNENEQRFSILLYAESVAEIRIINAVDVMFMEDEFTVMKDMRSLLVSRSELMATELGITAEEYEVEEILADKRVNKIRYFLVQWKGYKKPTWVKEKDCEHCPEKVKQYLNKGAHQIHCAYAAEEMVDTYLDSQKTSDPTVPSTAIDQYMEPKGYKAALCDIYVSEWLIAIKEELISLRKYGVFEELDYIPANRKILRLIWVFKGKRDETIQLCVSRPDWLFKDSCRLKEWITQKLMRLQ
jgi:transposase InsO family protein